MKCNNDCLSCEFDDCVYTTSSKQREYQKKYYDTHREKYHTYYEEHKEYFVQYRNMHKEELRLYQREYAQKRRAKLRNNNGIS